MGLDKRDSIVRRRMMQKFDFLFGNVAAAARPDDQELQSWYAEHGEAFQLPATITFEHVWFSPDKRGDSARDDASAVLEEFYSERDAKQDHTKLGDSFPFDTKFDEATFEQLARFLVKSSSGW